MSKENMYCNTSEYIRAALRKQIKDDTGLTSREEEIVAERLEKMEDREDKGKSLAEVSEELGIKK